MNEVTYSVGVTSLPNLVISLTLILKVAKIRIGTGLDHPILVPSVAGLTGTLTTCGNGNCSYIGSIVARECMARPRREVVRILFSTFYHLSDVS